LLSVFGTPFSPSGLYFFSVQLVDVWAPTVLPYYLPQPFLPKSLELSYFFCAFSPALPPASAPDFLLTFLVSPCLKSARRTATRSGSFESRKHFSPLWEMLSSLLSLFFCPTSRCSRTESSPARVADGLFGGIFHSGPCKTGAPFVRSGFPLSPGYMVPLIGQPFSFPLSRREGSSSLLIRLIMGGSPYAAFLPPFHIPLLLAVRVTSTLRQVDLGHHSRVDDVLPLLPPPPFPSGTSPRFRAVFMPIFPTAALFFSMVCAMCCVSIDLLFLTPFLPFP